MSLTLAERGGKMWERILILNHENHEVGCGCEVRWNALKAMFALTCNVSVCAVFDGFFCNFIKIMVSFGSGQQASLHFLSCGG